MKHTLTWTQVTGLSWTQVNGLYIDKVVIGMEVAASEFYGEKDKIYDLNFKKENNWKEKISGEQLKDLYKSFMSENPTVSIEDPFDQDDWEHYAKMTAECGEQVQIVGDDLLVTNPTYSMSQSSFKCATGGSSQSIFKDDAHIDIWYCYIFVRVRRLMGEGGAQSYQQSAEESKGPTTLESSQARDIKEPNQMSVASAEASGSKKWAIQAASTKTSVGNPSFDFTIPDMVHEKQQSEPEGLSLRVLYIIQSLRVLNHNLQNLPLKTLVNHNCCSRDTKKILATQWIIITRLMRDNKTNHQQQKIPVNAE
ncbi:enolase 2 [Artemisia annua]|uniref:phosphopyruvate hydratase n=1 Tax=Artemisia annua TaxID=35608 RepID=A0A2U1Q4L5_ARTAN|nr:enolase 2 [Artemisia annua]